MTPEISYPWSILHTPPPFPLDIISRVEVFSQDSSLHRYHIDLPHTAFVSQYAIFVLLLFYIKSILRRIYFFLLNKLSILCSTKKILNSTNFRMKLLENVVKIVDS